MTQDQIAEYLITHPAEWKGSIAKKEFHKLDKVQCYSVLVTARSRYAELLRTDTDFPQPPPHSLSDWLLSEAL